MAIGPAETLLSWRDNRLSANGDTQARRVLFIAGMTDHFALAYDGLNRLKSISGPVAESFALDGASNVTSRSGTLETYDNANRLTADGATALTWSNADRLDQRGSDTFGYDALDRMTSSNVSGTARSYTYNGDGLLQTRTGGVAASFLWDPTTSPSRELKQNSDNIVYGLGPLYVVKADATTLTFARDGSKSIRGEVTNTGAVTGAYRYRTYGQLAQSTSTNPGYVGYTGLLQDPSGLLYSRARWYDPVQGRFLSRDPAQGDNASPGSLNAYMYAAGNPVIRSDPSGTAWASETYADAAEDTDSQVVRPKRAAPLEGAYRFLKDLMWGADSKMQVIDDGVVLVENAGGIEGWLATFGGRLPGNTITWGSNYIVSSGELDLARLDHERHHIKQARAMGDRHVPAYLLELPQATIRWAFFNATGHSISWHDSHWMERDATIHSWPWIDPWSRK